MPTHKDIKLSIVSQWELKLYPEFPHPESSQFTFRSSRSTEDGLVPEYSSPAISADSKADKLLGKKSVVSVYIPSVPGKKSQYTNRLVAKDSTGSRFWLRYSIIEPAPPPCKLFYFKLYLNGRHITSWGINPKTTPNGQVMRALFEPSERWNYKDNGIILKNNGTESRPFFFGTEVNRCSAANDGGLIEVLCFRAKDRKRRIARSEEFRGQEKYGIVMPSGGLLDKPQDIRFYDWLLIDPKDDPFTTFRFHYRSWESLEMLQLIPASHPRTLLPSTPSLLSINGKHRGSGSKHTQANGGDVKKEEVEENEWEDKSEEDNNSISSEESTPWMTTVFDDSPDHSNNKTAQGSAFSFQSRPSLLYQRQQIDPSTNRLERPLPTLPIRSTSLHSRKSSSDSHAPSIAPSLLPYLDRDSTASPEPVICVAAVVPVLRSGFGDDSVAGDGSISGDDSVTQEPMPFSSPESYINLPPELSPPSTTPSKRLGITHPRDAAISPPNVTIRKHRHTSTKSPSTRSKILSARASDMEMEDSCYDNSTTLSLTESEWMSHTPSPIKRDPEKARVKKLWSPGVERHRHRDPASLERSALRKRSMDWYDEVRGYSDDGSPVSSRYGSEVKIRTGNWI
jgi:hypothetical protein